MSMTCSIMECKSPAPMLGVNSKPPGRSDRKVSSSNVSVIFERGSLCSARENSPLDAMRGNQQVGKTWHPYVLSQI